ncbi:MAG: copper-binding protein [Burkholderiales bacterium]|nr:copper-binding protein [Burkholderiales bacterium]
MQLAAILAAAALLAAGPAAAQGTAGSGHAHHAAPAAAPGAGADFSEAEVRRVDKDAKKVTLRHGPIPNLGMGNMTMVFGVVEPTWLDGLKAGDKVRFKADKVGGQYTVTAIEPMR